MLSHHEQKNILKRQLQLVNENIELTKEIEFRDYRISRLEKEIRELKQLLLKTTSQVTNKSTNQITLERIKIYV